MLLATIAFYLFSTVLIVAALMVVSARNPVHSVLFLILAFFNAAALFVLLGAEFLAMVLIVVYVGAVAVLFLFVVMMLDIDFVELRQGFLNYVPFGLVVGGVLLAELAIVGFGWVISPGAGAVAANPISADTTNTEALGPRALHEIRPRLPRRRHGAAGRHDRRHRADATPPRRREAPERVTNKSAAAAKTPSNCAKSGRGRGSNHG